MSKEEESNHQEQPDDRLPADVQGGTPAVEPETVAEAGPPAPSFSRRVLKFLFDREGRVGRVLRPVLRTTALIVGMFALGMLATYILYYRPQAQTLEETRSRLATVQAGLDTAQSDLQQTRRDLDKATADLAAMTTRSQVLEVLSRVNTIRYALAAGDKAAATTALEAANTALSPLLPAIKAGNVEVATAIQDRLGLVAREMSRDPKTAQADLGLLVETLQNLADAH